MRTGSRPKQACPPATKRGVLRHRRCEEVDRGRPAPVLQHELGKVVEHLDRNPDVVARGLREPGVGAVRGEGGHPLGVGGGEELAHRAALGDAEQCRSLAPRGVHHGTQVVHALLEGGRAARAVGEALAALVVAHEPGERLHPLGEVCGARVLPHHLLVGDESGHEHEVERTVARDLVGQAHVAVAGVADVWLVHAGEILPRTVRFVRVPATSVIVTRVRARVTCRRVTILIRTRRAPGVRSRTRMRRPERPVLIRARGFVLTERAASLAGNSIDTAARPGEPAGARASKASVRPRLRALTAAAGAAGASANARPSRFQAGSIGQAEAGEDRGRDVHYPDVGEGRCPGEPEARRRHERGPLQVASEAVAGVGRVVEVLLAVVGGHDHRPPLREVGGTRAYRGRAAARCGGRCPRSPAGSAAFATRPGAPPRRPPRGTRTRRRGRPRGR